MWSFEKSESNDSVGVVFALTSPDGDEGYPGTMHVHSPLSCHCRFRRRSS